VLMSTGCGMIWAVPTSHHWTGDPGKPAFAAPLDHTGYQPGTTTARRLSRHGEVRVFTRRFRTFPFLFIVVLGGLISIGPTSDAYPNDAHRFRIAVATVAGTALLLACRTIQLAVKVEPGKVIVRNLWWTHRLSIDRVQRFDRPRDNMFRGGLRVVLVSGRFISASAFGTMSNFESPERGAYEAGELNAWLGDQRSGTPSGPLKSLRPVSITFASLWIAWLVTVLSVTGFAISIVGSAILDPHGFLSS
jgi:hypothetical protein